MYRGVSIGLFFSLIPKSPCSHTIKFYSAFETNRWLVDCILVRLTSKLDVLG